MEVVQVKVHEVVNHFCLLVVDFELELIESGFVIELEVLIQVLAFHELV